VDHIIKLFWAKLLNCFLLSKLLLVMIKKFLENLGEYWKISKNLGGGRTTYGRLQIRAFAKRPYKVIDYLGNQLWQSLRTLPKCVM
jgi:hypothetical protein